MTPTECEKVLDRLKALHVRTGRECSCGRSWPCPDGRVLFGDPTTDDTPMLSARATSLPPAPASRDWERGQVGAARAEPFVGSEWTCPICGKVVRWPDGRVAHSLMH